MTTRRLSNKFIQSLLQVWVVSISIGFFFSATPVTSFQSSLNHPPSLGRSITTTTMHQSSSGNVELPTMEQTYTKLAEQAIERLNSLKQESKGRKRLWIALAGAPGAGKSTVAQAVVEKINSAASPTSAGIRATAIPMDGYHFSQLQMKEKGLQMKRRGAPWTFDAEGMYQDLSKAKMDNGDDAMSTITLPGYSRDISDPVPDMIEIAKDDSIIIVEGLYVLLGCLAKSVERELEDANSEIHQVVQYDDEWERRSIVEEILRWKPLADLWDETWFVDPPEGLIENQRRLVSRSLKTWNEEKTKLWGGNSAEESAQLRVAYNDLKNARLVRCCRFQAKEHIDSV